MGEGIPGPLKNIVNVECTWSQRSTPFLMHSRSPSRPPDLSSRLWFLLPALLCPRRPAALLPTGWRGRLREEIRLARNLHMIPECALELHLAAHCLKMEGRD